MLIVEVDAYWIALRRHDLSIVQYNQLKYIQFKFVKKSYIERYCLVSK
jgi:hypothetical protein